MKRAVLHWTGGSNRVSPLDLEHYHFVVDGDSAIHPGKHRIEDNLDTRDGHYAAHTKGLNRDSIGIAICGMSGATDKNPKASKFLPTQTQVETFCVLCARLCIQYGIEVTPTTVINHGEVEKLLGVPQAGKWDVCWLPWCGWDAPNWLRSKIQEHVTKIKTLTESKVIIK